MFEATGKRAQSPVELAALAALERYYRQELPEARVIDPPGYYRELSPGKCVYLQVRETYFLLLEDSQEVKDRIRAASSSQTGDLVRRSRFEGWAIYEDVD